MDKYTELFKLCQPQSTVDDQAPSILETIAKNIIAIRKEKGMTQEQLAHKAGIDRSYMGYIENTKHNEPQRSA